MNISGTTLALLGLMASILLWDQAALGTQTDSREYKLMLAAARFVGPDPAAAVGRLWNSELRPLIDQSLDPDGDREAIKSVELKLDKQRLVEFYDTPGCELRKAGFIFRVRVDAPNGARSDDQSEATLKFRSPDPAIAADHRFPQEGSKFEADISPVIAKGVIAGSDEIALVNRSAVLRIQYSSSIDKDIPESKRINKVADVFDVFDGTRVWLESIAQDTPLKLVSEFTAFERVYDLAVIDLGKKSDAKVSVTLWYDRDNGSFDRPVVAELSFKFDMPEDGKIDAKVPGRALQLFQSLQNLDDLFDPVSDSKTAFAYNIGNFCGDS